MPKHLIKETYMHFWSSLGCSKYKLCTVIESLGHASSVGADEKSQ